MKYTLSISKNYKGSELSVEPIGAYQKRSISLKDYCVDDNGKKTELNGTWLVNDKEYNADKVEISPVSSYIISYQYDSDKYFYCILRSVTVGSAEQNGRDAERAVAFLTA